MRRTGQTAVKSLVAFLQPLNGSRFSLATLLTLAVGATVLVVGSIGLALSISSDGRDWKAGQLGMGRNLAEMVASSLRSIEGTLDLIATQESLFVEIGTTGLDELREREPSLVEIVILAEGGDVILHSGDGEILLSAAELSSNSEWLRSVNAGRVYRGELETSSQEETALLIALPSVGGGLVAGRVRVDTLWDQVVENMAADARNLLLVAHDGRVVANGEYELTATEPPKLWQPAADGSWEEEDEWSGIYDGGADGRIVASAIRIQGLDWLAVVESSFTEAYASSRSALIVLLCGGAIALEALLLGARGFASARARVDDELKERLDELGITRDDPLSMGGVKERAIESEKRPPEDEEQRGSVLRRAKEYELAMSDLRKSQERYALAVRGANDGLWDWDLERDHMHFSPRWKAMLGHLDSEIPSHPIEWLERVHEEEREHLKRKINAHLEGVDSHLDYEHRMRHRDGYYLWVRTRGIAVRDETGLATRMAGVMTDITDRKRNEAQWQYDALHDSLTGLANRALFLDRLGHALERSKRTNQFKYAVLFLDLDKFKAVNDKLGHGIGDKLLVSVSKRLLRCLREIDTIARLGGDEFVLLLEEIKVLQDATTVAGRIHLELKPAFEIDGGHEIFTSTSIGVVLGAPHYDDPEQLLRDADTALYRAKELGRARSAIFDDDMRSITADRVQLESELRKAVDREELKLFFDPVISCADLALQGMHARVKTSEGASNDKGQQDHNGDSDDAGKMLQIGSWAIEEACRQRMSWRTALEPDCALYVSIELSPALMINADLQMLVRRITREWPTEARNVAFEIGAAAVDVDHRASKDLLEMLKSMGFQLHLTGCNQEHPANILLKKFPFDAVKIDRWYVDKLVRGDEDRDTIRKIINCAHQNGKIAIAEGAETEEHFAQVLALGSDYCQGAYVSQKLDSAGVMEMLQKSWALKRGKVEE